MSLEDLGKHTVRGFYKSSGNSETDRKMLVKRVREDARRRGETLAGTFVYPFPDGLVVDSMGDGRDTRCYFFFEEDGGMRND